MSIRSIGNPYGPQRPAAADPSAPATRATPATSAPAVKPAGPPAHAPAHAPAHGYRARHDSVAISDTGRALAGAESTAGAAALTPERVADLRRKVLEGAYNQTGVVEQVAKRLLASGEI